jgi:hypothetical protein
MNTNAKTKTASGTTFGRRMAALAAGLILAAATPAAVWAVCDQSSASTADQNLFTRHGCWQDFFLWQYQAYDMRGGDWAGRGWNDACNRNLEYPKHWNASYLVTYGLVDNFFQSFHGTADYRATAERWSGNFHLSDYQVPTDATNVVGSYNPNSSPHAVATSCLLYNPASANANPGSRAGDFMHEGWHGWMQRWGYNGGGGSCGHFNGPQGACSMNPCGCDYFYFHPISRYAFGAMWFQNGTSEFFHSMTQVQVEFLCDVSDQPQPWVPNSVRLAAAADANTRASQRFINGPGYSCGDPRPW